MAHLVENMAYVGQTPWHGLGNALAPRQSLDVWAKQAGMDWDILDTPVRFVTSKTNKQFGEILSFDDNKVLYRSDTRAPDRPATTPPTHPTIAPIVPKVFLPLFRTSIRSD